MLYKMNNYKFTTKKHGKNCSKKTPLYTCINAVSNDDT